MARNATAQTAVGPQFLAAVEHNEEPQRRLVDDDLAASFLPAHLRALVRATRSRRLREALISSMDRHAPGTWASIACRKRYIDERISDPLNEFDAVVVLGAGLDTRAYRIARHSNLPVFEVDQQVNIDRKAAAVRRALGDQPPSVRLVAADFERDDVMTALTAHGYRPDARTFFVCEGVTQYLTPPAVPALFTALHRAAPGSTLIFTFVRQDFIDGVNLYGAESLYRRFRQKSQLWQTGFEPERLVDTLAESGWRLIETAGPSYYRDTYIRGTGREVAASPIEWIAVAQR
ncbi:SAM-dependent methyltransferase [Mycolicibacterium palauense]|uniref:SAM-dependent methyltransferase n=1 Tax=Mycolicibacterium palauense TaxID=2034511 RepID=UPI000BFED2BC|nr:SAM-dependent methyltransferase [Mycolicibacterium palauense]